MMITIMMIMIPSSLSLLFSYAFNIILVSHCEVMMIFKAWENNDDDIIIIIIIIFSCLEYHPGFPHTINIILISLCEPRISIYFFISIIVIFYLFFSDTFNIILVSLCEPRICQFRSFTRGKRPDPNFIRR